MKHIVKAIGSRLPPHIVERAEERLFGQRDFERLQLPQSSALTVTCDDGEVRDLDIVEVLEAVGVKGVFAVSPDLIGRQGFLTYQQLREIRDAGHEIAFHGTTHDPFTGFSDKQCLVETIREGLERLNAEGLGMPTTLIYPYGRHNRAVRSAMTTLFHCAFTTWFGINRHRANRYAIRRIPFGAYVGGLPATEAWYRAMIRSSTSGKHWPTFMLHPSAKEHTAEHTALLFRLLRFARDEGLPIRTAVEHFEVAVDLPPARLRTTTPEQRQVSQ